MNAAALVKEYAERGVRLWRGEGDSLEIAAKPGIVKPNDLVRLRTAKPDILATLADSGPRGERPKEEAEPSLAIVPFDPREYLDLPKPGGQILRIGPPCPDCGSHRWDITRYTKMLKDIDDNPRPTVMVTCHCPRLWEYRRERLPEDLEVLGTLDVRTGIETWFERPEAREDRGRTWSAPVTPPKREGPSAPLGLAVSVASDWTAPDCPAWVFDESLTVPSADCRVADLRKTAELVASQTASRTKSPAEVVRPDPVPGHAVTVKEPVRARKKNPDWFA